MSESAAGPCPRIITPIGSQRRDRSLAHIRCKMRCIMRSFCGIVRAGRRSSLAKARDRRSVGATSNPAVPGCDSGHPGARSAGALRATKIASGDFVEPAKPCAMPVFQVAEPAARLCAFARKHMIHNNFFCAKNRHSRVCSPNANQLQTTRGREEPRMLESMTFEHQRSNMSYCCSHHRRRATRVEGWKSLIGTPAPAATVHGSRVRARPGSCARARQRARP